MDSEKAQRFDLSEVIFKWSKKSIQIRKISRHLKYAKNLSNETIKAIHYDTFTMPNIENPQRFCQH